MPAHVSTASATALVLLAALLSPNVLALEQPSLGVIAGESGAAVLGGVLAGGACGLGLGLLCMGHTGNDALDMPPAFVGALVGEAIGGPLGSAGGAALVGRACRQEGRFWTSYLGALVGLPVGYGIASLLPEAWYLGLLAPPVGAVIGYNLEPPGSDWYGRRVFFAPGLALAGPRHRRSLSTGLTLRIAI